MVLSLNPCFNGRCTRTKPESYTKDGKSGLNPCFNGRCTRTSVKITPITGAEFVLILVLMEDALVLKCSASYTCKTSVLILVLMEDALVRYRNRDSIEALSES